MQLDTLVHVKDTLFVALGEGLLLRLLLHGVDFLVSLGQDLVSQVQLALQLVDELGAASCAQLFVGDAELRDCL